MSLQVPTSIQLQRPKAYFYFYSPLRTVFSSPTVSDTTEVGTLYTTRTTAKTYTLNIPAGANTIRVIIYGYVNGATGYFILNIDGVDVATATTSATTETIIIDYVGSISPGAHTLRIDYYISQEGFAVILSKVYIATGIGLTSTTLTNLITFSITYQLLRQGDIRYSPGIRAFIWGNRKTTANATLQVGSNPITGRNQLRAGNDNNTAEVFLAIVTGSVTLQEGGEFTLNVSLRGRVGASGDVVIITRIQARAQLRRENFDVGEVRVYERGIAEYSAHAILVSVPDGASFTAHVVSFRDVRDVFIPNWIVISSRGSNVILHNYKVAVVTSIHFAVDYDDDYPGEAFIEWVSVVVVG